MAMTIDESKAYLLTAATDPLGASDRQSLSDLLRWQKFDTDEQQSLRERYPTAFEGRFTAISDDERKDCLLRRCFDPLMGVERDWLKDLLQQGKFTREEQGILRAKYPSLFAQDRRAMEAPVVDKRNVRPYVAIVAGLALLVAAGVWATHPSTPASSRTHAAADPRATDKNSRVASADVSDDRPGTQKATHGGFSGNAGGGGSDAAANTSVNVAGGGGGSGGGGGTLIDKGANDDVDNSDDQTDPPGSVVGYVGRSGDGTPCFDSLDSLEQAVNAQAANDTTGFNDAITKHAITLHSGEQVRGLGAAGFVGISSAKIRVESGHNAGDACYLQGMQGAVIVQHAP